MASIHPSSARGVPLARLPRRPIPVRKVSVRIFDNRNPTAVSNKHPNSQREPTYPTTPDATPIHSPGSPQPSPNAVANARGTANR